MTFVQSEMSTQLQILMGEGQAIYFYNLGARQFSAISPDFSFAYSNPVPP